MSDFTRKSDPSPSRQCWVFKSCCQKHCQIPQHWLMGEEGMGVCVCVEEEGLRCTSNLPEGRAVNLENCLAWGTKTWKKKYLAVLFASASVKLCISFNLQKKWQAKQKKRKKRKKKKTVVINYIGCANYFFPMIVEIFPFLFYTYHRPTPLVSNDVSNSFLINLPLLPKLLWLC